MILIAGGSGLLGTQVTQLLHAHGHSVRVLTRDPQYARHLESSQIETVTGSVQNPDAVAQAVAGARIVISAIHGFAGRGDSNPMTVDLQGNRALIQAAKSQGVERFILLSIHGATLDHPIELFRMKRRAEDALQASGVPWTIIRPTVYMETWTKLIGEPLVKTGKTRIFGRGENPINFVSASDVARYVTLAAEDGAMIGQCLEVDGPENLTMRQMAETIQRVTKVTGAISPVPLPMMRVMATLLRPVNPMLARQIQAAIVMDTTDMSFDPTTLRRRFPTMPITTLEDVVRRDFASGV
jgi:NADH dehydrogenase